MKEEMDFEEPKKKRGSGFWTTNRIIMVSLLVLGLLIGGYAEHQFIEPILTADYSKCKADLKSLNAEIQNCYLDKAALEKQLGKTSSN